MSNPTSTEAIQTNLSNDSAMISTHVKPDGRVGVPGGRGGLIFPRQRGMPAPNKGRKLSSEARIRREIRRAAGLKLYAILNSDELLKDFGAASLDRRAQMLLSLQQLHWPKELRDREAASGESESTAISINVTKADVCSNRVISF